jgi:hypothetical protein
MIWTDDFRVHNEVTRWLDLKRCWQAFDEDCHLPSKRQWIQIDNEREKNYALAISNKVAFSDISWSY